jgi:fibronectin type 3 domain-containing protein
MTRSTWAKWVLATIVAPALLLLAACSGTVNGGGSGEGGGGGGAATTVPPVPAGLMASAGNAQVSLVWSASAGTIRYNVKRSTTSGGPYSTISSPMGASFTDATVTNGTKYFYVVSAANSAGESANSNEVNATPAAPVQPPPAPAGLAATAGNAQVSLVWSVSTGATSYNVKRATMSGGPYVTISSPMGASFTDATVTNGTKYFYVVSAVNSAGESANSAEVNATPAGPVQPPPTPAGLAATAGNAQVSLAWSASTGATSYNVKRSTASGGPYTTISSSVMTNFTDTTVTNGTKYFYVVSAVNLASESANSTEVNATPVAPAQPPATPTGLAATPGNAQVSLSWNASTGATSYHVKRSTTSGGPYTTISSPTTTSSNDSTVTNGTAYFYVVSAVNGSGESANSSQVSAIPAGGVAAAVQVTVDALSNRHAISPYVYGVNFPANTAYITDSGATMIRWGGNAATNYNWKNFDTNAANDFYYVNRPMGSAPLYADSTQFVSNISAAGGYPIVTIGMLPWAAKDTTSYSFSVTKYGAQCATDPFLADAGNGVKSDCATNVTGNNLQDAYIAMLDGPPAGGDPAGSVYRNQWIAALATEFVNGRPHFYDMDNEIDIWGSTHRDVHPNPSGYNEMRDTFIGEARALKGWDAQAVRFGPVSCCWWFYWNGANNNDKNAHGGVDFLPWWLNEVLWSDEIAGTRSVDVLDIHAYPDGPDSLGSDTQAQKQAAALRIFRDYWDPTYVSESGGVNQQFATQIQPLRTIPFRLPRLRAMLNMIYPGTPLSITEWNAAFAGETDFSTALADADAFGIFGRERVTYASRWVAADSTAPAYQTLKLYRNYDGNQDTFGTTSISATHNADPDLFSVYAALSPTGTSMTLLVVNKDPTNIAQVGFTLNDFTATNFTAYTLSQESPTTIVASPSQGWSATQSFAAYSATLLVINGTLSKAPTAEWDLNPDTIQAAANSTITLAPRIVSATGNASVTIESAQFDAGSTSGGTISIATAFVTSAVNGAVTISTGSTAGFYHFTVTGQDSSGVTQTQGGWVLVGNPAATFAKAGDNQTGAPNANLALSVTLNAGSSGGTNTGASVLFTTDTGNFGGAKQQIVTTNGSGSAGVTLTLPAGAGTVHVTAEGPYGLGHPVVTFTETAN